MRNRAKLWRSAWTWSCVASVPGLAQAEPAAPTGHRPFLWFLVIAIAAAMAAVPWAAGRRLEDRHKRRLLWILSAIIILLFLVFIAPLILAFGSILITGRTM